MKKLKSKNERNPLLSVALGALLCALCLVGACVPATLITSSLPVPLLWADTAGLAALLVSGVISGLILPKVTSGRMLYPALSALSFVLILLLTGMAIGKGHLSVRCPINYSCYMGTVLLFSYLVGKKRRRRRVH